MWQLNSPAPLLRHPSKTLLRSPRVNLGSIVSSMFFGSKSAPLMPVEVELPSPVLDAPLMPVEVELPSPVLDAPSMPVEVVLPSPVLDPLPVGLGSISVTGGLE